MKKTMLVLVAVMLFGFVGKAQLLNVNIFNKKTGGGLVISGQTDNSVVNSEPSIGSHQFDIQPVGAGYYAIYWYGQDMILSIRAHEDCDVNVNAWTTKTAPASTAKLHRCWTITEVENGYYKIANAKSNCVLTALPAPGGLLTKEYTGADNQKWYFKQGSSRLYPRF